MERAVAQPEETGEIYITKTMKEPRMSEAADTAHSFPLISPACMLLTKRAAVSLSGLHEGESCLK